MNNFVFHLTTKLIFGKDTHKTVGDNIKPVAKKVLLHYGGQSIKKSGLYDQIIESLKAAGIEYVELGGVVPNPRVSLIRQGVEICRKEGVEFILAVGGGSVIDSAKGIAAAVYHDGDAWELYEKRVPVPNALPIGVVLTIPAAGSEMGGGSVVSNDEKQLKLGYGGPMLRPQFAVINPELFFTLPKNQVANGVADMISHVCERYFTNTLATDVTDGICESLIRTIMKNGLIALNDPTNYDAWCQLGLANTYAHNDVCGVGRAQDWACHSIEHELSAIYDVAHGAGLAVLTPNWMKYVYKDNINMFVQFAVNVMGVKGSFREPDSIVLEAIDKLREFFVKMGLPSTLKEIGIGEENLEVMAKKATGASTGTERGVGGLKKLMWQDVVEIYKLSL